MMNYYYFLILLQVYQSHLQRKRDNAKTRERWVSHWPGYTNALVRYDFYMFLHGRLKKMHVFGAFYLQSRFLAPFFEGEGGVATTNYNIYKR